MSNSQWIQTASNQNIDGYKVFSLKFTTTKSKQNQGKN